MILRNSARFISQHYLLYLIMVLPKSLPCYACRPGLGLADLQRLLAKGDVGLTIYRFRAPEDTRPGKETIILYTTRNIQAERRGEMNLEILEAGLPKCVNYCPRCKMMMRQIENMFASSPPADRPTNICELFSCPPGTDIVRKFRKFIADAIKNQDSEFIHLQRLASPRYGVDVKTRSIFDDAAKAELLKTAGFLKAMKGIEAEVADGTVKDLDGTKKEHSKDNEGIDTNKGIETGAIGTAKDLYKINREGSKDKEVINKDTGPAGAAKHLDVIKIKNIKDKKGTSKDGVVDAGAAAAAKHLDLRKIKDKKGIGKDGRIKVSVSETTKDLEVNKQRATTTRETRTLITLATSKKNKDGKRIKDSTDGKSLDKDKDTNMFDSSSSSKNLKLHWSKQIKSDDDSIPKPEPSTMKEKIIRHMRERLHKHQTNENLKAAKSVIRAHAENVRQKKFKKKMQHVTVASDVESDVIEECAQDEEVNEYIKGNRIYKKKNKLDQELLVEEREVTKQGRKTTGLPPPSSTTVELSSAKSSSPFKHDGVMEYRLSNRKYIRNGWTQLPKEMVVRKLPVFQMHPARDPYDWFKTHKSKGTVFYHSGAEMATFDENDPKLYYQNGHLAMEYYTAEDAKAGGRRILVYSNVKPEGGRPCPRTVLAVFDFAGNGVVYNHAGQIRLKYSQNEGVVLDRTIRPHTQWKWHNLNASPVLYTISIEDQPLIKDPRILKYGMHDCEPTFKSLSDEDLMKNIENKQFIKEHKTVLSQFVQFQVEMKTFKINEHFSLRIREQSQIFLSFSDGGKTVKTNVGFILDPNVVVGEDFVEIGVVNDLEGIPDCSDSVERLRKVTRRARAAEHARAARERKLNYTTSYILQKHQNR